MAPGQCIGGQARAKLGCYPKQVLKVPSNIFLVGPMGAGKTTIGRHLGRLLGKTFLDTDREIQERTGASVPLIFELEGEEGFRRREQQVLHELCRREGVVLATGGGAVLRPENRSELVGHGFVIYLCAPLNLLIERTCRDRNRPLLQTQDPRGRLEQILQERDPLYRQVADLIVKTDHRTVHGVVKEIYRRIKRA